MIQKKKKDKIPRWKRKKIQEKKQTQKALQDSKERLFERVQSNERFSKMGTKKAEPDEKKMSDIIVEYAQPLLNWAKTSEQKKFAIELSIAIWNNSQLPEEKQENQLIKLQNLIKAETNAPESHSDGGGDVFKFMLERRKALFSEINRVIVDFEITETPKEIHLSVVYNSLKKNLPDK